MNKYPVLICLAACLIAGCTLEDEYQEKIIVPNKSTPVETVDPAVREFSDLAHRCITGDTKALGPLKKKYWDSIRDPKSPQHLLFQTEKLNSEYERCVLKAMADNDMEFVEHANVDSPIASALLARGYYAREDYVSGAYWMKRLIALQGRMQGYELAGNIFLHNEATYEIGIKLLGEAALLGSRTATSELLMIAGGNEEDEEETETQEPKKAPQ